MDTALGVIDRTSSVYIPGHRGLVGFSAGAQVSGRGIYQPSSVRSPTDELDLTDRAANIPIPFSSRGLR